MPLIDGNDVASEMLSHGIGAICIDTSTYQKNGFAFDSGLLAQCPAIKESGLRLLIVDVIEREVLSHVASEVGDQVTALRRALRNGRKIGLADSAAVALMAFPDFEEGRYAKAWLDRFFDSAGVEIVRVAQHCDVQKIIDDYFAAAPPFEKNAKKKSEFPDALCLQALESFAEGMSRGILVVSEDKGWKDYAAASERIFLGPGLAEVLQSLPGKEEVQLRDAALAVAGANFVALRGRVELELRGLPAYADADVQYESETDIDEVGLAALPEPAVDGSEFKVVRVTDESLVVRWDVEATIEYQASISVSIRDPIDRDYVHLPGMTELGSQDIDLEILVTFDRGGEGHGEFTFATADIVTKELWFDLGAVEYSLAEDD